MIRPINSPSISLSFIAKEFGLEFSGDVKISGIAQSASDVESGDIFLALRGANHHGIEFIDQAVKNGAVAVITDLHGANEKLPTLIVENPRRVAGEIAALIYGQPMRNMFTVGITGTNGKTTVTTLLHQIWQEAKWSSGLIGTVNTLIDNEELPSLHTTPEAAPLHALMATMRERHTRAHALEVHRVGGAHFNVAGFTNLTQDHLDFHGSMEKYGAAKAKLFNLEYAENALINVDDSFGKQLFDNSTIPVISISRTARTATWHFEKIVVNGYRTEIAIRGEGGILIEGEISLIGEHNLDNLILAVALAFYSGVDPLVIAASLSSLRGAPGRLEIVNAGQDFLALVDYAHTPDAVMRTLQTAKKLSKRVIAVLGCGGDRDRTKRPLMGIELANGSDLAIFTSDNPRSESPEFILDEMMARVDKNENTLRFSDRREAIAYAVTSAKTDDCLVLLGKGHEVGQEISGRIYPFDDRIELAKAIEALS